MNKIKKILIITTGCIAVLFFCAYGVLQLTKLRSFQFFGRIYDRVETEEKVVALTFDDAPTPYMDEVLRILDDKGVPATFYVIGQAAEKYPEQLKSIIQRGDEIGNHSYSHRRMVFKSRKFIAEEIEKTNELIRAAGYKDAITFRPPYGKKLIGLPRYLHAHGITTITWDVEPDTYYNYNDADDKVRFVIERTRPGSIILLHPLCGDACTSSREALPKIIDALKKEGYTFVTVSQLLVRSYVK